MAAQAVAALVPYVPRLARDWPAGTVARELEGSLVSVDLSGFTALSERLAAKGRAGAEELVFLISAVFDGLIGAAAERGGDVLKFRGDALLIFFDGPGHERRACLAAAEMQDLIATSGTADSSVGPVSLTMSVGVFSGPSQFFAAGTSHRELIVAGPAATATIELEDAAQAGEILVATATAAALDRDWIAQERDGAFLLGSDFSAHAASVAAPRELPGAAAVDVDELLPQPLREALAGGAGEAEHRQVTTAFVKFSGAEAVLASEGIDGLGARIAAFAEAIGGAADEHGVTWLESDIDVDGGKAYLTAGAPTSGGFDEARMLRALQAVLSADVGLTLRAGVSRGSVLAGEIGAASRHTYAVMGDSVNLAARLTGRAQPGQLLATGAVLDRSDVLFESEAQPFLVKGKERAVTAYSVGAMLGRREDQAPQRLPLVGREAEVELLRGAVDAARVRSQRVVELVGEPGIGKSRLVEELLGLGIGFAQFVARCESHATAAPYFVFRPILRQLAGIVTDAGSGEAGEQLGAWVTAVMPDQAQWLPLLAVPFDATVPSTPEVDAIGPAFRRQRLHEVVGQFLTRVLLMPTLIVIEDTHWLDEASRDLLGALVAQPAPRPWLVCATRRPVGAPIVSADADGQHVLELGPLDAEATARLALAADDELTLGEEELEAVSARSGGNPLFVRELVAATSAGSTELPETVERLMTERIDTLPADDRLLLRYASVVGQWFDLGLMREILAGEQHDVDDLERWQRLSDFVERGPDDSFFFRHDLFRSAAYEGLSFRRRREIHARVGDVLERQAEDRAEEAAGLLSHHFLEAGDGERAWRYSVAAGRRAWARFANADATVFFRRALRAADELGAASPAEVAEVAEALGDVCELSAHYEDARDAYRRARASLTEDPLAQLRLARKEGTLLERLGRYDEAAAWFERALEWSPGDDPVAETELADLEIQYSVVLYRQGHHADCLRVAKGAAERAERVGNRAALAMAYRQIDVADRSLGGQDESWLRKALAIYAELDDPIGRATVLNNLGVRAYYAGRWDEAQSYYEQSREAEQASGDVVRAATASNNEAEILLDQGYVERAAELFQDALRVYRASGYAFGAAVVGFNLARAAAASGRFDEAHALFDDARAELVEIGSESFVLELDMRRAECHVLEGRYAEALELATATLEASERAGEAGPRVPLLERVRGLALVQARRPTEGRERLEASLEAARANDSDFEVALTLRALALTGRSECGEQAEEALRRLGVVDVPRPPLP